MAPSLVLAVTHEDDDHAAPVFAALERLGADIFRLDLADLPVRGRLSLRHGPGAGGRTLLLDGRTPLDLGAVTALWWRRIRRSAAHPGLPPTEAEFARVQADEAVLGLLSSLGVRMVNPPWADETASRKPHQLAVAERLGLPLPRTLVTSHPPDARAFLEALGPGGAVHKSLKPTADVWLPTRRVEPEDLDRLDALPLAPVIFQEHVPGLDVRVIAVGDALFPVEIDARLSSSPDDYRRVLGECAVRPGDLPGPLARGLRALLAALGLTYAAIDLRRRDDGAWFFLELNPAGQWLPLEALTGLPITAALAAHLAEPGGLAGRTS
jgi:hypothetical protein